MNTKIKKIDWTKANGRCKCGTCNHFIVRVHLANGDVWIPTYQEYVALKKMIEIVLEHNLASDKHCYRAEQAVSIEEVRE